MNGISLHFDSIGRTELYRLNESTEPFIVLQLCGLDQKKPAQRVHTMDAQTDVGGFGFQLGRIGKDICPAGPEQKQLETLFEILLGTTLEIARRGFDDDPEIPRGRLAIQAEHGSG